MTNPYPWKYAADFVLEKGAYVESNKAVIDPQSAEAIVRGIAVALGVDPEVAASNLADRYLAHNNLSIESRQGNTDAGGRGPAKLASISKYGKRSAPLALISLCRPLLEDDALSNDAINYACHRLVVAGRSSQVDPEQPIAALHRVRGERGDVSYMVLVDLIERVSYVVALTSTGRTPYADQPYIRVPVDSPEEAVRVVAALGDGTAGDQDPVL